jgi:hypothetical protein
MAAVDALSKIFSLHDLCAQSTPKQMAMVPGLWEKCLSTHWVGPPYSPSPDLPFPYGTLGAVYDPSTGSAGFKMGAFSPVVGMPDRVWLQVKAQDWLGMRPLPTAPHPLDIAAGAMDVVGKF